VDFLSGRNPDKTLVFIYIYIYFNLFFYSVTLLTTYYNPIYDNKNKKQKQKKQKNKKNKTKNQTTTTKKTNKKKTRKQQLLITTVISIYNTKTATYTTSTT